VYTQVARQYAEKESTTDEERKWKDSANDRQTAGVWIKEAKASQKVVPGASRSGVGAREWRVPTVGRCNILYLSTSSSLQFIV